MELILIVVLPIIVYVAVVEGMKEGFKNKDGKSHIKKVKSDVFRKMVVASIISQEEFDAYQVSQTSTEISKKEHQEYQEAMEALKILKNFQIITETEYEEKLEILKQLHGYM